jgi:hypothetical protein
LEIDEEYGMGNEIARYLEEIEEECWTRILCTNTKALRVNRGMTNRGSFPFDVSIACVNGECYPSILSPSTLKASTNVGIVFHLIFLFGSFQTCSNLITLHSILANYVLSVLHHPHPNLIKYSFYF